MRHLITFLFLFASLVSINVVHAALDCDCTVTIHTPLTGPIKLEPTVLRQFELRSFDSYNVRNQLECRKLCTEKFEAELPSARIDEILRTHSQDLINGRTLGYNCTGLTTLKYPVRVKAQLGQMSLGNVSDQMHIINHEEICFTAE
jgi:hypothetical protein